MAGQRLQEDNAIAQSIHQDWPQADPLVVGSEWLRSQVEKKALPNIDYEWLAADIADQRAQAQDVIIVQILDPAKRTRRRIMDATDGSLVLVAPAQQWRQLVDSISSRACCRRSNSASPQSKSKSRNGASGVLKQ